MSHGPTDGKWRFCKESYRHANATWYVHWYSFTAVSPVVKVPSTSAAKSKPKGMTEMTPGHCDRHRAFALGKRVHVLFDLRVCIPLSGLWKPSAARVIHFLCLQLAVCGIVSCYRHCFTGGQASEGLAALLFTRGSTVRLQSCANLLMLL